MKQWMVSPVDGDVALERILNEHARNSWEIFDVLEHRGGQGYQLSYKVIAFRNPEYDIPGVDGVPPRHIPCEHEVIGGQCRKCGGTLLR